MHDLFSNINSEDFVSIEMRDADIIMEEPNKDAMVFEED